MKKLTLIILSVVLLISTSCSIQTSKTKIPTTTTNTTDQYQKAVQKLISDAVKLAVTQADYDNKIRQIEQEKADLNSQISNLQGQLNNLQINFDNNIVKYQQLAQDYSNLQLNNSKLDNAFNELFKNMTYLKSILFAISNGTGLDSANMTSDEKSVFYSLFHKWYVNELPNSVK